MIVTELGEQTITFESDSHWVPHVSQLSLMIHFHHLVFGTVVECLPMVQETGVSVAIQGKEYHSPLYLSVVAIEKGAFGSPLITVGQLTYNKI